VFVFDILLARGVWRKCCCRLTQLLTAKRRKPRRHGPRYWLHLRLLHVLFTCLDCLRGKSEVGSAALDACVIYSAWAYMHIRCSRWHRHSRFTRAHSQTAGLSHQHDLHCQSRHGGKSCSALSGNHRAACQSTWPAQGHEGRGLAILAIEQTLTSLCIFGSSHQEALPLTPCKTSLIRSHVRPCSDWVL
jgi:hypothetical protein